jgi:arabinogalactan oligomer/maltooligosaccharide transport system substrate-binding protein
MITDAERLVIAKEFANFITNEESQIARFNDRAIGPSNIRAGSNPAVQANLALAALAAQSAFATSQNDVLGSYWAPAGAFGAAMVNQIGTDLQSLLNSMAAQIQS